ncbi:MAG: cytochrome P450 [Anaerolineae bacterium]|nr:cytochrome P450 [Anaerolineae bacterium]
MNTPTPIPPSTQTSTGKCPVNHSPSASNLDAQYKTPRTIQHDYQRIERDADGVWHLYVFDDAKTILRYSETTQMGFKAEMMNRMPHEMRTPILYLEGPAHLEQRKQTARFFTPKAVSGYRPAMEAVADAMMSKLQREQKTDLRQLSLSMAMRVVSEVVGLTNSRASGIEKRLDVFLREETRFKPGSLMHKIYNLTNQLYILLFFWLDVKPSIEARKKQPKDDLITYLIEQGYKDWEIFTESLTYGAAGMATTREFIALAGWHLLTKPALKARYLQTAEAERHAILHEILRLEPIVSVLKRRAADDIRIENDGQAVEIRKGDVIHIHVQTVNTDKTLVGTDGDQLCPMRDMHKQVVMPSVMSFGDGHHRCPGAYVAIYETDVFLQRLLRLDNIHIVHEPEFVWSDTSSGFETKNFVVAV